MTMLGEIDAFGMIDGLEMAAISDWHMPLGMCRGKGSRPSNSCPGTGKESNDPGSDVGNLEAEWTRSWMS